jgi:HK97 gp10 family phage protein
MANPSALTITIQGMREAKAAFQALPQAFRDRLNDATELTVQEIVRQAVARVIASPSVRTGALRDHIAWKMNRTNGRGRVGMALGITTLRTGGAPVRVRGIIVPGKGGSARKSQGARIVNPSYYAHLVEYGTRHMPAEPFMRPSVDSQQQPYLDRCRAAGRLVEQDLANLGSRAL